MLGLTEKKIKLQINKSSFFYFTALDLYLLDILMSCNARLGFWLDAIPKQYTFMSVIVIVLLLSKMLNDEYTRDELIKVFLIGVLFAVWILTAANYTYMPLLFMFIIASKGIDFEKIILNYLVIHAFMFCITVGGCMLGLISNFEKLGENGIIVKCLGYTTYNAPVMLCVATFLFTYYEKSNLKLWHILLISLIDIYVFSQSKVQMPFYMTIALLVMAYIIKLTEKMSAPLSENSLSGFIARNVFFFGIIIAFALSLLYNLESDFWVNLNSFLTNRLSLSQTALSTYGVGIFGKSITWSYIQDANYLYPDSGYIQYAINYGAVYLIFMLMVFRHMGKYAIETNDRYLLLVLIMLSVYSVVNPTMFSLCFSPWLLMGGGLIYQQSDNRLKSVIYENY